MVYLVILQILSKLVKVPTANEAPSRPRLSRERILQAAVDVADAEGLDALTMRRLGNELGVEAMSLYKHVANKDAILDGIIDHVIAEIEMPTEGPDWKTAMRQRAHSARNVFRRHSWAVGLYETRDNNGPAVLRYLDATIGSLRSAGFSLENAAHAFWVLDCFIYGQVVMESSMTFESSAELTASSDDSLEALASSEHPHLGALAAHAQKVDFTTSDEFERGLELILDALEHLAGSSVG